MICIFTGIDNFTSNIEEHIEIKADLMKDDVKIYHNENSVEIYINDDREIVTKESFKVTIK